MSSQRRLGTSKAAACTGKSDVQGWQSGRRRRRRRATGYGRGWDTWEEEKKTTMLRVGLKLLNLAMSVNDHIIFFVLRNEWIAEALPIKALKQCVAAGRGEVRIKSNTT